MPTVSDYKYKYSDEEFGKIDIAQKKEETNQGSALAGLVKNNKARSDTFCELKQCLEKWNDGEDKNSVLKKKVELEKKVMTPDVLKKVTNLTKKLNEIRNLKEKETQG